MSSPLNLDFVKIPAGEFSIGSDPQQDRSHHPDELPCHRLHVTDYYLMRYPVTNAQYRMFVEASGHRKPLFWKDGQYPEALSEHPVVGVSFFDTLAFCRWARQETGLSLRLPSEPEWEKAARGSDGQLYPWGNQWDAGLTNTREAKIGATTPVGKFSPQGDSMYGVADMAGNVQCWVSSLFGPYPYDPTDGRETLVYDLDPDELLPRIRETGCTSVPESLEAGLDKSMIRGGSWRESKLQSRCAYRSWAAPMHRSDDTGFRLCYESE
jgi:formylglycine-generating enzyme required for sulfatase activity